MVIRVDEEADDEQAKTAANDAYGQDCRFQTGRVPVAPVFCDVLVFQ